MAHPPVPDATPAGDLFPPPAAGPVPLTEQIVCVRRELGFRGRVYPRQVARGRMSQADADHELRAMQAVLTTLESLR